MKRKIAIEIISFMFILLFVYAALNKLIDYQKFVIQIGQSPLLTGLGPSIAWIVIAAEVTISILLIIPTTRLAAFYLAFGIMMMFTAYIFAILNFSSHIPCSCGGVLEKLGWGEHLIFNIIFIVLGLTGIILQTLENEKIENSLYSNV